MARGDAGESGSSRPVITTERTDHVLAAGQWVRTLEQEPPSAGEIRGYFAVERKHRSPAIGVREAADRAMVRSTKNQSPVFPRSQRILVTHLFATFQHPQPRRKLS
jgi:hypothetical protein